ncbi:MAG: hypothetical protein ACP5N7_04605 [Candidatus Pacearchaeota archaeon]
MKREIEISVKIKGMKRKYGVRGDFRFLPHLLKAIENTVRLVLKEKKTEADKAQIKELNKTK